MNDLATRRAPITAVDTSTRTVTARLVTWNDPRDVVDPDGARYRETFTPGGLVPRDRVYVVDEHGGQLIGRAVNHRDDGTGHVADLEVADTTAGRDLLALVDAGIIDAVSVEFDQRGGDNTWSADRTAVTRSNAPLHGVAFAFHPAHTAPVLAVRNEETMTMTMPDTPIAANGRVIDVEPDDVLAMRAELVHIREDLAARGQPPTNPLAGYQTAADFYAVALTDPLAARTLTDQITTNNPGVIPPGWVQDVKGIVTFGRPGITAIGGARPLPDAGMDINWPYYDGTLTDLIGVQATQKTAVTSHRVDLKKGNSALVTYAGASDISYQLIRRSSPSYLDAYMRIMTAAYSAVTDKAFVDALVAGAGGSIDLPPGSATAAQIMSAIFQASMRVFLATGQPASAVIADSVWFGALGALLFPGQYGTYNQIGTAQASNLEVSLSGLRVAYDPYMAAGKMIVTNGAAAAWHEDGPLVATNEDVEKLGHDVAVWGMAAPAIYTAAGVQVIYDVP